VGRLVRATPIVGALIVFAFSGSPGEHASAESVRYLVVFESTRAGGRSQIYTVPPKRSERVTRLTRFRPAPANQASPSVSLQTNEVAVSSDEGASWGIDVVASNGSRRTVGSPQRTNADPVWSPNGNRLAFESNHAGNWDIDIAFADGSQLQRITRSPAKDMDPSWSPDGSRIVFTRTGRRGSDIYMINVNSRFVRRLTRTGAPEFDPNWSPDGKLIVFDRVVGGDYDLWTMTPGGKKQNRLTHGVGNDVDPVWSPDSERVAFQSDRTGDYEVFIVNSDGSSTVNVSNSPQAVDVEPTWKKAQTSTPAGTGAQVHRLASGGYACTKGTTEKHGRVTVIRGTDQNDFLCGEAGRDVLFAQAGRDYVYGGNGQDKIYGGLDGDYILALDGTKDRLFGGRGDYDDSRGDRAWMDRYSKGDVNVKRSVDVVSP
jgi:Tol biopolymer transport system component